MAMSHKRRAECAAIGGKSPPSAEQLLDERAITPKRAKLGVNFEPGEVHLPFSRSQFSLALSVQKSKPVGITTRDFCVRLQQHIEEESHSIRDGSRYIDTFEFWRDQYSNLREENMALERRVVQLESIASPRNPEIRAIPHALIQNAADVLGRNISEFQFSGQVSTDRPCSLIDDSVTIYNLPLLKQAFELHRLVQDDKTPPDILLSAIQTHLSYMSMALSQTYKLTDSGQKTKAKVPKPRVFHLFQTIAALFNMCLNGLAHLCRDIPGRRCKGQVVYSLVLFFSTALGHLKSLCIQDELLRTSKMKENLHPASSRTPPEADGGLYFLICEYSGLLANTLTCPEILKANRAHTEVVEGMFSVLLQEIGVSLSKVVFNDHLSSKSKTGRKAGEKLNGLNDMNGSASNLMGLHLTSVLRRALKIKSGNDSSYLFTMLGDAKTAAVKDGNESLLAHTKRRLQETMLKGMFGSDGERFLNALKIPGSETSWGFEASEIGQDESETFVESVWSIIGWDILLGG